MADDNSSGGMRLISGLREVEGTRVEDPDLHEFLLVHGSGFSKLSCPPSADWSLSSTARAFPFPFTSYEVWQERCASSAGAIIETQCVVIANRMSERLAGWSEVGVWIILRWAVWHSYARAREQGIREPDSFTTCCCLSKCGTCIAVKLTSKRDNRLVS